VLLEAEERARQKATKINIDREVAEKAAREQKKRALNEKIEREGVNQSVNAKADNKNSLRASKTQTAFVSVGFLGVIGVVGIITIIVVVGLFSKIRMPLSFLPQSTQTSLPSDTPTIKPISTSTLLPFEIIDAKGAQMVLVPVGDFTMGNETGYGSEQTVPVHKVYLDSYYIDKYEVTNALYRACVDAGVCKLPTDTRRLLNGAYKNYPVVFIDWNMAKNYCEWHGSQLPTEAQWEKAARGTDTRTFPWGEGFDCSKANFGLCLEGTTPVGSYESGKSIYGAYDMIGNAYEWVADWFSSNYYENSPSSNPLGPSSGQLRVTRGGSSGTAEFGLVGVSARDAQDPTTTYSAMGFRCVYNP
jgi:formylglycine-generating enzyme required for sulfatase activity